MAEFPQTAGGSFSVGSVLSQGFAIFFQNFVPFMLLAVVVFSPLILYTAWVDFSPENPDLIEAVETWSVMLMVLGVPLAMILNAALVYGTFRQLRGDPAPIGAALGQGIARALPVLGVAILSTVCIMLGFVLLIIPGLIVMTALWVAIPVAVVEKPGIVASLKRSVDLTAGYRWSIFAIIFLVGAIERFATFIVENMGVSNIGIYLGALLAIVAVVSAIDSVVTAVGYHDLRVAKEGVDTEQIASVFD